jgi:hypothetical protein
MTAVKTLWGPATIGSVTGNASVLNPISLNDADNAAGWIFTIPRDGTITDVGVLVVSENGTSPAYNVGLTTLDTNGRPTTSAYGGSAITSKTWTAAGFSWTTLSTPATGAAGDFAAVHVYPTGSTPTGVNFVGVVNAGAVLGMGLNANFTVAWSVAQTTGTAGYAIKYDDGSIRGLALSTSTVHVQLRSNTTPDEAGCLFTVPANMTCTGARLFHGATGAGSAATLDVVLYSAADGVLASTSISDKDFIDDWAYIDVFWDSVNLSANTNYRLIAKPTTAANGDIFLQKWSFESTAAMAVMPCGDTWQYTSRTDAGAWTNDNTAISPMGLWLNNITFIAGSGSGGTEWGFVG